MSFTRSTLTKQKQWLSCVIVYNTDPGTREIEREDVSEGIQKDRYKFNFRNYSPDSCSYVKMKKSYWQNKR